VNLIHIPCSTKPPLTDVLHLYAFVCMFELYSKYFLNTEKQYILYEAFTDVCMCVCVYVCMYVCMYVCVMFMYVYVCMYVCICVCMYACIVL
jgi:hypothetical protein